MQPEHQSHMIIIILGDTEISSAIRQNKKKPIHRLTIQTHIRLMLTHLEFSITKKWPLSQDCEMQLPAMKKKLVSGPSTKIITVFSIIYYEWLFILNHFNFKTVHRLHGIFAWMCIYFTAHRSCVKCSTEFISTFQTRKHSIKILVRLQNFSK